MYPADLIKGLENLQGASDNLVTNVNLHRGTLLKVNCELGRLLRRLQGIYIYM